MDRFEVLIPVSAAVLQLSPEWIEGAPGIVVGILFTVFTLSWIYVNIIRPFQLKRTEEPELIQKKESAQAVISTMEAIGHEICDADGALQVLLDQHSPKMPEQHSQIFKKFGVEPEPQWHNISVVMLLEEILELWKDDKLNREKNRKIHTDQTKAILKHIETQEKVNRSLLEAIEGVHNA